MKRKELRQLLFDALNNTTSAGAKVYRTRTAPINEDTLPAILVYVNRTGGTAPDGTTNIPVFLATHEAVVEVRVSAERDWDIVLDDLTDEVETQLLVVADIPKHFERMPTFNVDYTFNDAEGETRIAAAIITMTFEIKCIFNPGDAITDDFTDVGIRIDTNDPADPNLVPGGIGPDGRVEAEIEVGVPI